MPAGKSDPLAFTMLLLLLGLRSTRPDPPAPDDEDGVGGPLLVR